jgi:hypothetical protein
VRLTAPLSLTVVLGLALACTATAAVADTAPVVPCTPPGSLECPAYERYENHKYAFSVDVPAFFVRKPADADGRGQPFEYGGKVRIRAWAMFDNPPMSLEQLYGDWTRRDGVTFKTLAMNTWVVRGKDGGRLFYSRSILADGIISTVEVTYAPEVADAMEPVLARLGASLMVLPGAGLRGRAH